jgi:hypothetical protein
MAVNLSALRSGRALLPRNIIFLLLIPISIRGWVNPSRKDYVNWKKKSSSTSSGLEPATFQLVALTSTLPMYQYVIFFKHFSVYSACVVVRKRWGHLTLYAFFIFEDCILLRLLLQSLIIIIIIIIIQTNNIHGLSPRAKYTDRATAACRRSDCQLLRIEGTTWSAWLIPTAVFSIF